MAKGSVITAFALVLTYATVYGQSVDRPYRNDRLLIFPKQDAQPSLEKVRQSRGHKVRAHFEDLGVDVLELDGRTDPAIVAKQYIDEGLVEFAEPDYRIHAADVPNDPGFSHCWGLNNVGSGGGVANADIRAELGWTSRHSAEDVVVAVIDSGVRYTHEDLAANMWHNPKEIPDNGKDDDGNGIIDDIYGYNAFDKTNDPWDDCGHGTHVAGTIGAVGNNGKGVAGVCWNVKIMALKFMASDGWGDTSDAIACINYARKNGAKVINASWGSPDSSVALRNAINAARSAGIIVVVAAGNESVNNDLNPSYPANISLDNIVAVAAINNRGELDDYSNWGRTRVDLAAPGTGIYSTSFQGDDQYEYMTGTSMAAPHVTGAIALLRAAYPAENYLAIINRLYSGVAKSSSLNGKCVTGGSLNIANLFPAPAAALAGISSIQLTANGDVQLQLADGSSSEILETSIDLVTWQPLSGAKQVGANLQLTAQNGAHRFYRVRTP
jgi:subtilisin family serine protease